MTIPAGQELPYSGIVTVAELQAYMAGINLNPLQGNVAAQVLLGTQNTLEEYINRPVEPMQIREVVQTDAVGVGYLSKSPVWKIISYTGISGWQPLGILVSYPYVPASAMVRDPLIGEHGQMVDHLYPVVNDPLLVPGGVNIGVPESLYAVEYVAGYNGQADAQLKLAIMRVAARELAHNHDESINFRGDGAEQTNPADNRQIGWTEAELADFDRLRRRVIA